MCQRGPDVTDPPSPHKKKFRPTNCVPQYRFETTELEPDNQLVKASFFSKSRALQQVNLPDSHGINGADICMPSPSGVSGAGFVKDCLVNDSERNKFKKPVTLVTSCIFEDLPERNPNKGFQSAKRQCLSKLGDSAHVQIEEPSMDDFDEWHLCMRHWWETVHGRRKQRRAARNAWNVAHSQSREKRYLRRLMKLINQVNSSKTTDQDGFDQIKPLDPSVNSKIQVVP